MQRHLFFLKDPSLLLAETEGDAGGAALEVKVPQWVHILPKPDKSGLIQSRDNRVLHVDDLEKLAARSNAALKKQKGGGPVDADHKIYGWPGGGEALGWAEEFEVRPSGLFARVEWLDKGRELVGSKKYRYTSSVVFGPMEPEIDEEAWTVTWHITPEIVEGFAITNIPALTTQAMFSQLGLGGLSATPSDEVLQVLLKKMGLSATASPAEVRGAWEALAKKLSAAAAAFVPDDIAAERAAHATTKLELTTLEERIAKLVDEQAETRVRQLVHDGRLAPSQREAALKIAKAPGGVERLDELYANAPRIVADPPAPTTRTDSPTPHGLNPTAFALAQKGVPLEQIVQQLKQQRAKE